MKKIIAILSFVLLLFTVNSCASNNDSRERSGGGGRMEQPNQEGPDFDQMALDLGVSVEDLEAALGDPKDITPEIIKEAAEALGVTEDDLIEALGPPPGNGPQQK